MANTVLASSLLALHFLFVNSYPIFRLESLTLWFLVWAVFTATFFLLRRWKLEWLFYAGLVFFLADCFGGVAEHLKKAGGWAAVAAVLIVWIGLVYSIRQKIKSVLFTGLAAALISGVFFQLAMPPRFFVSHEFAAGPAGNRPNVYFFILDEHIGLARMPEIAGMYTGNGFVVYSRAYSNYDSTFDSIPSYLNARIFPAWRSELEKKTLKTNRLFEKWNEEGFRLNVYQSTHLDLAHSRGVPIARSFVYRESSVGYLRESPLSYSARLWILSNNFIEDSRSHFLKKIKRRLRPLQKIHGSVMTGALAVDRVLDEIKKDTLRHRAGTVFFAHFLSPHSSYLYDADCSLWADPDRWEAPHYGERDARGTLNTDRDREKKYALYENQVRCLHQKLGAFFDFLRREGLYESSTIFIVSDHGSRISRTSLKAAYLDHLTKDDFEDAFLAFLAFKKGNPGGESSARLGEIVGRQTPASLVIKKFFGLSEGDAAQEEALRKIYLKTDDIKKYKAWDMPDTE